MSNKHIELVKKWLEDNDSVSLKELKQNSKAAHAGHVDAAWASRAARVEAARVAARVAASVDADSAADSAAYASYAAEAAYAADAAWAARAAHAAARDANTDAAKYWVARYEAITNVK